MNTVVMTLVYTTAAGPAFNNIGWKYYLVFIIVTSAMLPYLALRFPETKGLSLEEVGALFGDESVGFGDLSDVQHQDLDGAMSDKSREDTTVKTEYSQPKQSNPDAEHIEYTA